MAIFLYSFPVSRRDKYSHEDDLNKIKVLTFTQVV